MAKIDLDIVKRTLTRSIDDERKIHEILIDLQNAMEEDAGEKTPPVKKQFCILISDPNGVIDTDLVGWIAQIPEEESPATLADRITRGAYEFNATPKGRRLPVQKIGEAIEAVPAKIFKEQKVWIKTKEPVLVLTTTGQIPTSSSQLDAVDGTPA